MTASKRMILIKGIDLTGTGYHKTNYIYPYDESCEIDRLMMEKHYSKCEIVWDVVRLKQKKQLMPNGHYAEYWNCDGEVYARYADGSCGPLAEIAMST